MNVLVESVLLERNNNKNYKIKTVLSDWAMTGIRISNIFCKRKGFGLKQK